MSSSLPHDTKRNNCSRLLAVPKRSSLRDTDARRSCDRDRDQRARAYYARHAYEIHGLVETDGRFIFKSDWMLTSSLYVLDTHFGTQT